MFPLQTPGPAAYKVVNPCIYRQKPPQYSMTGRNFVPGETTKKPGPGAHYPERVRNPIMSYLIITKALAFCSLIDIFFLHRWPSQKQKLQVSPLVCITQNISHPSLSTCLNNVTNFNCNFTHQYQIKQNKQTTQDYWDQILFLQLQALVYLYLSFIVFYLYLKKKNWIVYSSFLSVHLFLVDLEN